MVIVQTCLLPVTIKDSVDSNTGSGGMYNYMTYIFMHGGECIYILCGSGIHRLVVRDRLLLCELHDVFVWCAVHV